MDPTLLTMATAFGTALATTTGSQIFSGPMQTLNDWWYIRYGHKSAEERALLEISQEQKIDSLKSRIYEKVTEIPAESLQEPPISILGPAIEASRFYIDEEEIRNMFANLISSSLDQRKNKTIHHSFVEIIKQLSPNDARILNLFNSNQNLPFADYQLESKLTSSTSRVAELIFMEIDTEYEKHSISLTNLSRLGLVSIRRGEWFSDESKYDKFSNSKLFDDLKENNPEEIARRKNISAIENFSLEEFMVANVLTEQEVNELIEEKDLTVEKGLISITPLGNAFLKICF